MVVTLFPRRDSRGDPIIWAKNRASVYPTEAQETGVPIVPHVHEITPSTSGLFDHEGC